VPPRDEPLRLTFGILGSVEVLAGGQPIALGGQKQRALLAILILHATEAVSAERLIEELWGEEPPPSAPKMLQVLVSRLRRTLEAGAAQGRLLVTRPAGYSLLLAPDQVDLRRFEAIVARARTRSRTSPGGARTDLHEALGMWRGGPLSDVAQEPFARWAIPRLEELRLAVLEERIEADLAEGQADLVGELRALVASHPLRERFAAQLMLGLYRTGRQAEALEVYHVIRARLEEEIGIEPSHDLQRLQIAILRQDPVLDAPSASALIEVAERSAPEADPGRVAGTASSARNPVARPDTSRRGIRRRTAAVAGVAAVLGGILAISGPGLLAQPGRPTPAKDSTSTPPQPASIVAAPNSVAILDPATDQLVVDIAVGDAPGPIAIDTDAAWVGSSEDHTVIQIDLASRDVTRTFGLSEAPASLAVGGGAVWIGNGFTGTLSRILDAYHQLSPPFFPGRNVTGLLAMAIAPGDLWVGLGDGTLVRMDPASLQVRQSVLVPDRVKAIALSGDVAWTIQFRGDLVRQVDRVHGMTGTQIMLPGSPQAIATGAGSIWVATSGPDEVWQVDPRGGQTVASIPLDLSPSAVVAGPDAVWVLDGVHGIVERLDPAGHALPTTVKLGRPVGGMALAGSDLWLTIR
jgi:DNA-binding SARP family transcriptional activator